MSEEDRNNFKTYMSEKKDFTDLIIKDKEDNYYYSAIYVNELQQEIERLQSIIKEVREYIEKNTEEKKSWLNGIPDYTVFKGDAKELLEILDKEN